MKSTLRVGFTYDLRDDYRARGYTDHQTAEFDSAETIDCIESSLRAAGLQVVRIGTLESLVKQLTLGERWDFVFNIAEGLKGVSREARIPALLEAYNIPFVFSSAWTMMVTLDKALAKTVLRQARVPTAPWHVVEKESDLDAIDLSYPLFVKPLAEGSSLGVEDCSLVQNRCALVASCRKLWLTYDQPMLVEPFLSGREFTVGVLGTGSTARVIGVMERHLDQLEKNFARSFANKQIDHENQRFYSLCRTSVAEQAAEVALQAWTAVKGQDAGRIDLRCARNGTPYVLDINALAGLRPGYSDLCILAELAGMGYQALIMAILKEFYNRCLPWEELRAAS